MARVTIPTDHLFGKDGNHVKLLRQLNDEELAEQAAWYRSEAQRLDWATAPYAAWCTRNLAQTADHVIAERRGGPTVEQWEADLERIENELDAQDGSTT